MNNKIKLAVIRTNSSDVCPFGLDITEACLHAGKSVMNMQKGNAEDNNEIYNKFIKDNRNNKCIYAQNILNNFNSVDCNFGEPNLGTDINKGLGETPARLFYGGINGLQTYPPGVLSDRYDISRNLYYGTYDSVYTDASITNNNALLKEGIFLSEEKMELLTEAQALDNIVIQELPADHHHHHNDDSVFLYSDKPSKELVLDMHDPSINGDDSADMVVGPDFFQHPVESLMQQFNHHTNHESEHMDDHVDVVDVHGDINIILPKVPGAPEDIEDIVVEDSDEEETSKKSDKEESSKKPKSKWDWEAHGVHGFLNWIHERINDVPRHSGKDLAGLDRAVAYLEKLDSEISKAMRSDLDGTLNADHIENVRAQIEDGIDRLEDRIEKIKQSKKGGKKKASSFSPELIKEAQKSPGIKGIMVTVPLFISYIGRVIISGMINSGHDAEDMFRKLAKHYKLTDREKVEVIQFLDDSGVPLRMDRGHLEYHDLDERSSDNFDWSAQYRA